MRSRIYPYGNSNITGSNEEAVNRSVYEHGFGNRLLEFSSWLSHLVARLIAFRDLNFPISIIGMMLVFPF